MTGHRNQSEQRIVAIYDYRDADGILAFQVVRRDPKSFFQRQPDGHGGWINNLKGASALPYRLPELLASDPSEPIFVVEGEKDVDALLECGATATTLPGGAISADPGERAREGFAALRKHLKGRRVVVIPDNDDAGRQHAQAVATGLHGVAEDVRICALPGVPDKGDVADFLSADGSLARLHDLAGLAPTWTSMEADDSAKVGAPNWYAECDASRSGAVLATHANFMRALRGEPCWRGVIAYDLMRCRSTLLGPAPIAPGSKPDGGPFPREWTDDDGRRALEYMQFLGFPTAKLSDVEHAIEQFARENAFHPIRDWLESLDWDGINRFDGETTQNGEIIDSFPKRHLGAEDTEYAREACRVVLTGAVARIFEPGSKFDYMLVLEGEQGSGKSTFCRTLAGPEFFSDSLPDMSSREAAMHLRGVWIVEVSELSGLRKSDVEMAKAFISRQEDRYRPPYGRREQSWPRQCIFIGTTNSPDYLKDPSGGRRFLPLETGDIDNDLLALERDQIWAEAVDRYQRGEAPVLIPTAIAAAGCAQARRYDADVWADDIARYIIGEEEVKITDILANGIHLEIGRQDQRHKVRVANVLQSLGWSPARTGKKGRFWRAPG